MLKTHGLMVKIFSLCLMTCLAAGLTLPGEAAAQDDKNGRLSRELQRAMARQGPLTEDDCRLYQAHLEKIFAAGQNPQNAAETAAGIGWTESRFAYITTKMAVGMSILLKPEDPRNQAVPAFARPTDREMSLIGSHRDDLVKSMEALQALDAN